MNKLKKRNYGWRVEEAERRRALRHRLIKIKLVGFVISDSQTGIIMTLLGGGKADANDSDLNSSTSDSSSNGSGSSSSSSSSSDDGDTLHSKSILQTKLSSLALRIIYCGTTVAIIALVVLLVRFCIEEYIINGESFNVSQLHNFVKFFIIAVTILVM